MIKGEIAVHRCEMSSGLNDLDAVVSGLISSSTTKLPITVTLLSHV